MFSTNAAGLHKKVNSLKKELIESNAAVFSIQETHFAKKGKLKVNNFEIFEAIRKKEKGGTMVGVHKALSPMLIQEYCEDFELLVIEMKIKNREIRVISGYGPQESWKEEQRMPFFAALEEEVAKAELMGKSVIIEMDSNSKLGSEYIKDDPHTQTANGKVLAGIVDRHGLVVVNGLSDRCYGSITRKRVTKDSSEESIIDHLLITEDLKSDFVSLTIDEEQKHVLTSVTKTKHGVKKQKSDHNALVSKFNITWSRKLKSNRIEMYNLKNKECQETFKELTNHGTYLSEVFDTSDNLHDKTEEFIKRLNKVIKSSFRKIRISDRPDKELENLLDRRKVLKNKTDYDSKKELEEVEKILDEKYAEHNYNKIKEEISKIKVDEGGIHSGSLWKLKKKVSPRCRDPPTAMLDSAGNLLTSPDAIDKAALETYEKRLQNRPIKDDLKNLQKEKEELCQLRLKAARMKKTSPWTMEDLEVVLKYLKKDKSRDPLGFANELFQPGVAGDDLKHAILKLANSIKEEQLYPKALEKYNISSVYKSKGSRNDFNSYRGIFRVPIFRTIIDRLIYNDEYDNIDEELTDSNVGARKNRNIRDNIFVLNAITNSIVNGNESAVDLQIFDVEKCFDALWMQECINDLYETGFDNDKLSILYLENQNAEIAVKTPNGITERRTINNVVMQGTVWGSLFCTATMDKLGKLIYENDDLLYKYKNEVSIPSLGMVDDILSIQKCSIDAVKINAVINAFIESKKLTLSKKKCNRIHISKRTNHNVCPEVKVHDATMPNSDREKYLGDIVDKSGKIRATIEDRQKKGYGLTAEILAILNEIPLGQFKMEIGLQLRQAMLLNGMLYNSEVWHAISEDELRMLEIVDEHLLRSLVNGHSKTSKEFLYLEAGATPIRYIISSRRLMYLQTILKMSEDELTKRVYLAQKADAVNGDFAKLVKADIELIGGTLNEDYILMKSKTAFKEEIKEKVRKAAFVYLKNLQKEHSKVKNIVYTKFQTQEYMTSPIFTNEDVNILHAFRSRSVNVKCNFRNKYLNNLLCPLCLEEEDDQPHLLECAELRKMFNTEDISRNKSVYQDIFADHTKQKEITHLLSKLIDVRNELLDKNLCKVRDPSISEEVLEDSVNLLDCIVYYSSGK